MGAYARSRSLAAAGLFHDGTVARFWGIAPGGTLDCASVSRADLARDT